MLREYKTVEIRTVEGLKAAERMHANGWKQSRVGLFSIQFYRDKPQKAKRNQQEG